MFSKLYLFFFDLGRVLCAPLLLFYRVKKRSTNGARVKTAELPRGAVYVCNHVGFSDPMAVEIADNTVILTAEGGRRLHVQIDMNVPYVLRKGMSIPLESSPSPFDQLQGGMISNLLTVYFKTGDEPITLRATAWEEGKSYTPAPM